MNMALGLNTHRNLSTQPGPSHSLTQWVSPPQILLNLPDLALVTTSSVQAYLVCQPTFKIPPGPALPAPESTSPWYNTCNRSIQQIYPIYTQGLDQDSHPAYQTSLPCSTAFTPPNSFSTLKHNTTPTSSLLLQPTLSILDRTNKEGPHN